MSGWAANVEVVLVAAAADYCFALLASGSHYVSVVCCGTNMSHHARARCRLLASTEFTGEGVASGRGPKPFSRLLFRDLLELCPCQLLVAHHPRMGTEEVAQFGTIRT